MADKHNDIFTSARLSGTVVKFSFLQTALRSESVLSVSALPSILRKGTVIFSRDEIPPAVPYGLYQFSRILRVRTSSRLKD